MILLIVVFIISFIGKNNFDSDYWMQTNGPFGCNVTEIAIGPSGVIFCGTRDAGLFKSYDNGSSWNPCSIELDGKTIDEIAITDSGYIFIHVQGSRLESSGVYKSNNNGASWTNTSMLPNVTDILIDKNDFVYISSATAGLLKSEDYGETWIELTNEAPAFIYQMAANDSGIYIASNSISTKELSKETETNSSDGIYFSNDFGDTWIELISGAFSTVATNSFKHVIAGIAKSHDLFISNNFGKNWTNIANFPGYDANTIMFYNDSTIFAASDTNLFRSNNYGEDWHNVGIKGGRTNAIVFTSNDILFVGNSLGVFKSTDYGYEWVSTNNGIFNPNIFTMLSHQDIVYAGGNGGGLFYSINKGMDWFTLGTGQILQHNIYDIEINNQERLYIGTSLQSPDGRLFYSDDFGLMWESKAINLPIEGQEIWAIVLENDSCAYIGTNGSGVLELKSNNEIAPTALNNGFIQAIEIDNSGNMFAGSIGNGIFISKDNGKNWESKNNGLDNYNIFDIKIIDNAIYVGNEDGFYKSANQGDLWVKIEFSTTSRPVKTIKAFGDDIFIGTDGSGVFRFSKNENIWYHLHDSNIDSVIWALTIDNDGFLYAGTKNGVFKSINTVTTLPNSYTNNIIKDFIILKSFPNPFNTSTTISYTINTRVKVKLDVYSINGEHVVNIFNKFLTPGFYNTKWDSKNKNKENVSSGIYFVVLSNGINVNAEKIVLLK